MHSKREGGAVQAGRKLFKMRARLVCLLMEGALLTLSTTENVVFPSRPAVFFFILSLDHHDHHRLGSFLGGPVPIFNFNLKKKFYNIPVLELLRAIERVSASD